MIDWPPKISRWKSQIAKRNQALISLVIVTARSHNAWHHEAKTKADLFAKTFASKFSLPPLEVNAYAADVDPQLDYLGLLPLTQELVKGSLKKLREDSATGPDLLPTRVLTNCWEELVDPVATLPSAVDSSCFSHFVAIRLCRT